jgi:signal peptidase I
LLAPGVGHLYAGSDGHALLLFLCFVIVDLISVLIVPDLAFTALLIGGAATALADGSLRIGAAISAYRATRRLGFVKMGRYQHVGVYICLILAMPLANAVISPEYHMQSFWTPSGAMVPTLMPRDRIMVDQKRYLGPAPSRGDVVVFKLPSDHTTVYVKRVIGLPGDRIQVQHGIVYINDQPCPRSRIEDYRFEEGNGTTLPVRQYIETLPNGRQHRIIQLTDDGPLDNTGVYEVPPGKYFMVGDNRDNSKDSRVLSEFGYVPAENLIGPAELIYWPLNRVSVSVDKGETGAIPPVPERQSEAAPALPTTPSNAPQAGVRPGPQEFAGSDWPMVGISPATDQAATPATLQKIMDAGRESDRRGWNLRVVSSEQERTSATIYADKMLVYLDPTTEKYKTLKAAGMALDYPITFTGRQSNCVLSDYAVADSRRSPKETVLPVDQVKNYISDAKAVAVIHGMTCARDAGIVSEEVVYVELVGEAAKNMRQSADQIAQAGIRMFKPLCPSTPDADRCAVFGTRLGQRPSEPRDLADRLRPAAILQLPDTRRA